ncbi:MAG: 50S ribosomal protein L11 methyltransferase [Desulfobacteraceae bacterium]
MEAKIIFSSDNDDLAADLIADVFYSLKAKGVVIDDPGLEPAESWAPDAVERPTRPAVTGYTPVDDQIEHHRLTLERSLCRLAGEYPFDYTIEYKLINEDDWAQAWKAFFWPQKITPRIVVKPTWREYAKEQGQLIIEIDPGMAFGTGTHPTTCLCIQLLEKYLQSGEAVLDVGTGSGILLVAAAKLGASKMAGVDLDPMAVDIARRNLTHNKVAPAAVKLECGDLVNRVTGSYDVVVANILAEVIIDLLADVVKVVKPGGLFICSGIIETSQTAVLEKMASCGFDLLEQQHDGEWVAMVGRRTGDMGSI